MNSGPNLPTVNPQLLEQLAKNQEKDLLLRSQELELKKQSDNNSYNYSLQALEANKEDREANRTYYKTIIKATYWFSGLIIFAFFIFLSYALFLGKEKIVMEIIKAILYIAAGAMGGYGFGKRKSKTESDK